MFNRRGGGLKAVGIGPAHGHDVSGLPQILKTVFQQPAEHPFPAVGRNDSGADVKSSAASTIEAGRVKDETDQFTLKESAAGGLSVCPAFFQDHVQRVRSQMQRNRIIGKNKTALYDDSVWRKRWSSKN